MLNQSEGTLDAYEAEKTENFQNTKGTDALVQTNEDFLPTAAKEQLLQQAEVEEGGFRAWATVLGALVIPSFGHLSSVTSCQPACSCNLLVLGRSTSLKPWQANLIRL
jgi:hypothetical protein